MRKIKVVLFVALLIIIPSINTYSAGPKPVELTKVTDQIWLHTSYQIYNGYTTPSNGLVVVSKKGLIMIDTCWDNESTGELLKLATDKFKQKFVLAVITHGGHADRIGGIDTLLQQGIEVISTKQVAQTAVEAGFKPPLPKLEQTSDFEIGEVKIETYYPGAGHSVDNLIVWFPDSKVLFAGCLIKSLDANNLGNLADASVKEWPNSLKNLLKKYPDAKLVIPGHGNWGDNSLISHTLELF